MRLPDGERVRVGHRSLLETLRELQAEVEAAGGAAAEPARAAAAFLRHSLLPFAREEEAALGALAPDVEGVALDHAFLAAEIHALAAEAREPGFDARAVRRRLHRVEAVLELHLAREEERKAGPAPVGEPTHAARGDRPTASGARSG